MKRKSAITAELDKLTKNLEKLGKTSIQVGVFGEDSAEMVQIARVHEYGMTIKPKKAKALTIPVSPKAKGKRARDFPNLFRPKGTRVLAIPKGKDDIEVLFVLVPSITIPERSFLRSGFDENESYIADKMESLMPDVVSGEIDIDVFADMIGLEFAGLIQKKLRSITSPANSSTTKTVKGSSNPLHDTGRLVGSIRHRVE